MIKTSKRMVVKTSSSNISQTGESLLFWPETAQHVEAVLLERIREHVPPHHGRGLDYLETQNSLLLSYLIDWTAHVRAQLKRGWWPTPPAARSSPRSGDSSDEPPADHDDDGIIIQNRLLEMRTVLDKVRGLDKKLRYQIDKLLAAAANTPENDESRSEALGREEDVDDDDNNDDADRWKQEDPLSFRPEPSALDDDDDDDDANEEQDDQDGNSNNNKFGARRPQLSDDDIDEEEGLEEGSRDDDDDDDGEEDDDLAAARQTIAAATHPNKTQRKPTQRRKDANRRGDDDLNNHDDMDDEEDDGGNDGIYRAPRLAAVPYTHDVEDRRAAKERRLKQRLRASEVAQALRSQVGEAPEQEDTRGGTTALLMTTAATSGQGGRSSHPSDMDAVRRLAQREKERTRFEEDFMMRLSTSRQEKKEKKRLMRAQAGGGDLAAVADLGNLVRDVSTLSRFHQSDAGDDDDDRGRGYGQASRDAVASGERHANGKRKREFMNRDGSTAGVAGKSKKPLKARNELQQALFSGRSFDSKKKSGQKSKGAKRRG